MSNLSTEPKFRRMHQKHDNDSINYPILKFRFDNPTRKKTKLLNNNIWDLNCHNCQDNNVVNSIKGNYCCVLCYWALRKIENPEYTSTINLRPLESYMGMELSPSSHSISTDEKSNSTHSDISHYSSLSIKQEDLNMSTDLIFQDFPESSGNETNSQFSGYCSKNRSE